MTTDKTDTVFSSSIAPTKANGVVVLGTSRPANCTDSMAFNTIAGGTYTLKYQIEDLPQTVDLETLLGSALTTGSMAISGFQFLSWDTASSATIDVQSSLINLSAQTKNLVFSATGATPVTNAKIKIETFYGCV